MLDTTLANKKPMLVNYFKGLLDGEDWVYSATEQQVEAELAKWYKVDVTDPGMKVAYDTVITPHNIRNPPVLDTSGFGQTVSFTAKFNPALANVDIKSILDESPLDQAIAEHKKS